MQHELHAFANRLVVCQNYFTFLPTKTRQDKTSTKQMLRCVYTDGDFCMFAGVICSVYNIELLTVWFAIAKSTHVRITQPESRWGKGGNPRGNLEFKENCPKRCSLAAFAAFMWDQGPSLSWVGIAVMAIEYVTKKGCAHPHILRINV